ncbi:MAG: hypothetical protein ACK4UJ_06495 [Leptonema sp. (in: bacteria)]
MIKFFKTVYPFLFFLFAFCSQKNEVLVEIKTKDKIESIKRKDLEFVTKLNQFEKKEVSVAIQNQILEELAFLTVGKLEQESRPSPIDEKEIKKALLFSEKKAFLNAMNFVIQNKASDFKYKYILMRLLFLKKDPNMDRSEEANHILKELNSLTKEEEIEKLIFEKSENIRYKILGGFIDPLCYNCGQNPIPHLIEPLLNEKENKFILVTDSNGYWIVKKVDLKEIKESQIFHIYEDYYRKTQFVARKFLNNQNLTKDFTENELNSIKQQILLEEGKIRELAKEQANHQIKMLKKININLHLQELQEKFQFSINSQTINFLNEKRINEWNPEWVVFEYNQKKYLLSDFFAEIKKEDTAWEELGFNEALNLLTQVFINYEILKLSPYAKEAEETKQVFLDLIQKQVFTNQYIKNQFGQISVTEEEIHKYYELRKNNEFKSGSRVLSLKEVSEKIKETLLAEKRQKKLAEVKTELFKKYEVKFYKERLKEGKI